jgi:AraC-like DNA-binding protein
VAASNSSQPPRAPAVVEGAARVGPLAIPPVLREMGVDPNEVLVSAAVDPELFDNPDNLITFATAGRLLGACIARTGCPHFGLLVGQQSGAVSLGLPGLLMLRSANVGEALRNLVAHLCLQDRGAVPTLSVQGKVATLGYAIYEPGVENTDQIADAAIAIACNILRALCGPEWVPTQVLFAHRRPADVQPYRSFFRAAVGFDAVQNALVFPARWLAQPLPEANADLRCRLQEEVARLDSRYALSFAAKVRRALRAVVIAGNCSAAGVAHSFGLQRRTLNRRLRAEGTTFETLLGEVRHEVACQLLGNTNMRVRSVSDALGYADSAAFTRAFRRWSGTTPARWRKANDVDKTSGSTNRPLSALVDE